MLTRWNVGPLSRFAPPNLDTFDELRRQMNRLFFDFESGYPFGPEPAGESWPPVALEDTGPAFVVRAEVPGIDAKAIELAVDDGTVTLKGEREEKPPEGYTVQRRERANYRFTRSFALPNKVDSDKVSAELKNGVLTVTLPKAKEAQPRQIPVKS